MPAARIVKFLVVFLLLVSAFALLAATEAADRYLHRPLSAFFAAIAAPILAPFGETDVSGGYLLFDGFAAEIVEACNGVLPAYIYLSAILAFPSRWRDRGWGIAIGLPAIFLINLVRIVTLMFLGARWPEVFEQVHLYVWQSLIVALSMGVWLFWAERFVRPRLRTSA